MKKDFLQAFRKKAYLMIYLQIIIILLIAIFYFIFKGKSDFLFALVGGICWLLPSFYFTRKLFIMPGNKSAIYIVKNFYLGEIVKLVFSGILIVLSFKFLHVDAVPFLVAYFAAVLSIGIYPIILLMG
jgi:ATP synthase protein I